ncbi:nitroreductase family protein [Clostridium cellulovorans]|uniref:Nitroreductase n=1 Tax=Clostridium cellulovorans (strain ATCC 35296 / DSM 3052 / OCM 3 / 743B) TaxID=573061 RepID=D9SP07_CLOC7|nr:nitroreductase family protein [Clostridium cellulovorans]ADL51972.1 nitroreductase [Clostridium cellulovorans 743B]
MILYNKPINEIIEERTSVRGYKGKLEADVKEKLISYLKNLDGPFKGKIRYAFVDMDFDTTKDLKLGTYGVVKGATSYLVCILEQESQEQDKVELGYEVESFILYCTSLGIGSCWMGGTFNKSNFAKAVNLKENEIILIVSPLGYPREKKSFMEKAMVAVAGSKNRKLWNELFFDRNLSKPLKKEDAGKYSQALEMVRKAPSAMNKQPWRIIKVDDSFYFHIAEGRHYGLECVDIGIAMCHFDMTLKEQGINGKWTKEEVNVIKWEVI